MFFLEWSYKCNFFIIINNCHPISIISESMCLWCTRTCPRLRSHPQWTHPAWIFLWLCSDWAASAPLCPDSPPDLWRCPPPPCSHWPEMQREQPWGGVKEEWRRGLIVRHTHQLQWSQQVFTGLEVVQTLNDRWEPLVVSHTAQRSDDSVPIVVDVKHGTFLLKCTQREDVRVGH